MKIRTILLGLVVLLTGVLQAQDWQKNLEDAQVKAEKENKKTVLVFQGSDWCAPCIKLGREVWETEEFKAYAEENFVMVQMDFPRKKANALDPKQQEYNNSIAERYNKNGYFPFVVVFGKNRKIIGQTGYKKTTPKEYIKILEGFKI